MIPNINRLRWFIKINPASMMLPYKAPMDRKIPIITRSRRRIVWVVSINPWIVPTIYKKVINRLKEKKKKTVRLTRRAINGFFWGLVNFIYVLYCLV